MTLTDLDGDTLASSPKFHLGILLVHGIGTQRSGQTLVQWGDSLIKSIGRATNGVVRASAEWAKPDDSSREGAAHAVLRLDFKDQRERWLIDEGWWADIFPPPTYSELVSWSVKALPWALVTHVAQRYWQGAGDIGRSNLHALYVLLRALFQLVLAFALAPVFLALLGLTVALGWLPFQQLREFIIAIQSTLTASVGDSLAFVDSPVRAALIRTRILERLHRLQQQCEQTVIVAHSQGAAAALDALGGIDGPNDTVLLRSNPPACPDALVTFGAGINQLVSLKVLASERARSRLGTDPVNVAVIALYVALGALASLYWVIRNGERSVGELGSCTAQFAGYVVLVGLVLALTLWLVDRFGKDRPGPVRIAVVLASLVCFGLVWAWDMLSPACPKVSLALLFGTLLMFAASLKAVLSRGMKEVVTKPAGKPPGLARWVDLFASADPVPNGPTRVRWPEEVESIEIYNRGSLLTDHTAYWSNPTGFVARVVRVCAETADSPWRGLLPAEDPVAEQRARWRVRTLALARWSSSALIGLAGWLAWHLHQVEIPSLFESLSPALDWLPRLLLLGGLVIAAIWVATSLLNAIWTWWRRSEEDGNDYVWPLVLMYMVVGFLLSSVVGLHSVSSLAEISLHVLSGQVVRRIFLVSLGFGLLCTLVSEWLFGARARKALGTTGRGQAAK